MLTKRALGQTDIEISPLGLGTVKFGRNQQVKYPRRFTIPDDNSIKNLLALAYEQGINLLDTAPAYGSSEERLGKLLPHRTDWVIVSKVGEFFEQGQSRFDFSDQVVRQTVENTLRKLRTDYLDMVLIHSHGDDMQIIQQEPVIETLLQLKQKGVIRAIGMSTKTTQGSLWTVQHLDVVMAVRNPIDHTDDAALDLAAELRKGVIIKKGLQSGHADKSAGGAGIDQAIQYVFSHPAVSSLIVGTINPRHLQENIELVKQFI